MRLIYTPEAIFDLHWLRAFIAQPSPTAATRISSELVYGIAKLHDFPLLGRAVEQAPDPEKIRDLLLGQCIVRYLLLENSIYILRVWHFREDRA